MIFFKNFQATLTCLFFLFTSFCYANTHQIYSPDRKIQISVFTEPQLQWQVMIDSTIILDRSNISIDGFYTSNNENFIVGKNIFDETENIISNDQIINSPFYIFSSLQDKYSELQLIINNAIVYFRAYNDAVAYRIKLLNSYPLYLNNEVVQLNFAKPNRMIIPYVNDNRDDERYTFSFEAFYDDTTYENIFVDSLFYTPFLTEFDNNIKVCFIESDVHNYPGLFIKKDNKNNLVSEFAPHVNSDKIGGYDSLNLIPTSRSNFIAIVDTNKFLPWRGLIISRNDSEIPCNTLSYKLSSNSNSNDNTWIHPGKVVWDWWNDLNLTDVEFEPGINTITYKHYIDFAHDNNLEYIILDEGWSDKNDIYTVNNSINLEELISYGKEKNVSLILWSTWRNIKNSTEDIFKFYSNKGIAGFKIDFFDRNDQNCISSMEEIAQLASKYHLLLDYHGAKPFGQHRMFPNIINFEGVKGAENYKWEAINENGTIHDFPRNDVLISFLRNLEGPVDYTPGAMINSNRKSFKADSHLPMSATTRAHQAALYTGYYAPLQMLADSPSNYRKDQAFTDIIASLPTTFDYSICLDADIDKFVMIARKKENTWYVSCINSSTENEITLSYDFLDKGNWKATLLRDGDDANQNAESYIIETEKVNSKTQKKIILKEGGGFLCIIKK